MDTVRIKLLTSLVTMSRGYERGEEVDWDREDAARLIKAGYAKSVEDRSPQRK